jgi:hypothetical protein
MSPSPGNLLFWRSLRVGVEKGARMGPIALTFLLHYRSARLSRRQKRTLHAYVVTKRMHELKNADCCQIVIAAVQDDLP